MQIWRTGFCMFLRMWCRLRRLQQSGTDFFLGKPATQSSYVLFDGQAIIPSRNVRKINTTWRSHMACYLHCKCFSWQYKAGFGARILPTMKKPIPKAVGFDVPLGHIEDTKLHDKDANDVIRHAEQGQKAEQEQLMMSANHPLDLALVRSWVKTQQPKFRRNWTMMVLLCQCQVPLCSWKRLVLHQCNSKLMTED